MTAPRPSAGQLAALLLVLGAGCEAEDARDHDGGRDSGKDAATEAPTPDIAPEVQSDGGAEALPGTCTVTVPRSRWAQWPMPDPGPGPAMASYDTATAGVVVDRVTQLMWQRHVPAAGHDWAQAEAYCACLELAGHDDWRLPTRIELVSLVDYTRAFPAIDPAAFPDTPSEWFWTATERADERSSAWFVYFENGYSHHHAKDEPAWRVRCVRNTGAPTLPGPRYETVPGGVKELRTGLTWQVALDGQLRSWEAAKAHCQGLTTAGGGWRLPSMKELQALVDDSRAEPSIEPLFLDTPLEPFWTASAVAATPGSAWRVSFIHGYTYDASAAFEYHTRCVK